MYISLGSCYTNLISAGYHEFPIGTRLVIINIQSVPKFKNKVPTFSPLFYFKKNDVPDV